MRRYDARSWTAEELQNARDNVVSRVRKTNNISATARSLGVSRQVVYKWLKIFRSEWDKCRKNGKKPRIRPRKRGRPKRRGRPSTKRRKAFTTGKSLIQTDLYRLGDIADACGFSRQTIHNYTKMGLITPSQVTKGEHRLYPGSVLEIITSIQELKKTHTLRGIIRIFQRTQL